jgi:hypothetical protein
MRRRAIRHTSLRAAQVLSKPSLKANEGDGTAAGWTDFPTGQFRVPSTIS